MWYQSFEFHQRVMCLCKALWDWGQWGGGGWGVGGGVGKQESAAPVAFYYLWIISYFGQRYRIDYIFANIEFAIDYALYSTPLGNIVRLVLFFPLVKNAVSIGLLINVIFLDSSSFSSVHYVHGSIVKDSLDSHILAILWILLKTLVGFYAHLNFLIFTHYFR